MINEISFFGKSNSTAVSIAFFIPGSMLKTKKLPQKIPKQLVIKEL
jgi:hypothetical protein